MSIGYLTIIRIIILTMLITAINAMAYPLIIVVPEQDGAVVDDISYTMYSYMISVI